MFHVEPGDREANGATGAERETSLSTCRQQSIPLSDRQIALMDRYAAGLLKWNKKINLISRRDEANIWEKHISHCISLLSAVQIPNDSKIVDIGTGGGLPGVPIKILRPDLSFLLLDATRKKTEAVLEIVKSLGLKGVEIAWGRAETVAFQPKYHRKFDFAVARSVASLPELIDWSGPFLVDRSDRAREDARDAPLQLASPALLAFKGGDLADEIREAERKRKRVTIRVVDLFQDAKLIQNRSGKKLVVVNW
jgi:16S rRNA (guanine527-N7)-methyltransferase